MDIEVKQIKVKPEVVVNYPGNILRGFQANRKVDQVPSTTHHPLTVPQNEFQCAHASWTFDGGVDRCNNATIDGLSNGYLCGYHDRLTFRKNVRRPNEVVSEDPLVDAIIALERRELSKVEREKVLAYEHGVVGIHVVKGATCKVEFNYHPTVEDLEGFFGDEEATF